MTPQKLTGTVQLEGMEFYAFHGCYKEEQLVGNKFLVDLDIQTDCSLSANSDNLKEALNYQTAYLLVKKEMEIKSHLLEHVCKRILDRLNEQFTEIQHVRIKVSKINPPMGGKIEKVSVTLFY
jgi:dihydroneopterin aldolase